MKNRNDFHVGILFRGGIIAVSLFALFIMGTVACSRQAQNDTGVGNPTSGSTQGTIWTGGNPTTPTSPAIISTGTTAATCTNSSATGCSQWDAPAANSVLTNYSAVNPATSSISSDLQTATQNLLAQAASNGSSSVTNTSCASSSSAAQIVQAQSSGCFNRFALASVMSQQCGQNLNAYKPLPGEPLVGQYTGTCSGKPISAVVSGDYNAYTAVFTSSFPQLSGVPIPLQADQNGATTASGKGALGTLSWSLTANDYPTTSIISISLKNPVAKTGCNTTLTMTKSANPIPPKAAQGLKVLGDCYRKVLLLSSPMFDTIFNNQSGNQSMQLILSMMNLPAN